MRSFTVLFLFLSIFTIGQTTGNLTGRIIDEIALPLAGAELSIQNSEVFTTSDNNGFYSIAKLKPGSYILVANYFGFSEVNRKFEIKAGETTELNFALKRGINLEGVQVVGSLDGVAKALNQQKNMVNVGNIISSDQVDQFPDDNMGDALKRVAGINVQYDQGEPRFGNIRGTSPELSSVTLDGNRLPSAEGETRAFQLDLIPADLVQAIEVNKVVTPDMDGDAIGASVNLVTRSVPNKRRVRIDLRGGYNTISEKANYKGAVLYSDRIAENKLGLTLSAAVFNNFIDSDNYEMEWDDDGKNDEVYAKDFQVRDYSLQRLRQNYSAAFDYKFNKDHRVEFKAGYNQRDDYENRFRLRYKKIKWDKDENSYVGKVYRQTKGGTKKDARLEKQKLINFKLNGKHQFSFMKMKWGASLAKANEKRPNERYITLKSDGSVALNEDYSNPREVTYYARKESDINIRNFEFDELTEEFQWTEEEDKTFYLDFTIPLTNGYYENKFKVGTKFKFKDKERDNEFYEYEPLNEDAFLAETLKNIENKTDSDFQATKVPIGDFISEVYLGGINLNDGKFEKESNYEEIAGNYKASEDIVAGYIRYDQKIGKEWMFVGGLRLEKTKVSYNGFITKVEENEVKPTGEQNKDFTNWMPSLLIKYSPSKNWNIKFGVTNTISRPRYFDLVPYQIINNEDNQIEIGNSDLEPTKSFNIDLMGERYFKNIGLIEAGIFYKNIKDFIVDERYEDYDYNGHIWDKFKRPINGGDATLFGVELGFQRPLDFIALGLKDFSLYTNYTFTSSNVSNFNIEDREDEDLKLAGTPEHTFNASLAYNTKIVEARLSYNHASDFVDEFGDSAFKDRYYDAVDYLDFNVGYNITKHINAYLKINNILNQPLRYFQGQEDRTMQVEYYGTKYKLGIQINL